jgi:nitrite reductase/ring-hydroxylating ferredoxin subunit
MPSPRILSIPAQLQAAGTTHASFEPALPLSQLPEGSMARVSRGDLDLLLVHSADGLAAIDDRCPHMSAPFSEGRLEGCVLHCPLHRGAFDLHDSSVVTFPTTGGLTADGDYQPTWSPPGSEAKPPLRPDDPKARARALTRVRRLRYYPLRVVDDVIEVAWPR